MTAEIAILNKTAVALAADSAVTISTRQGQKVYNTVNKLFGLSKFCPVGVMVFGSGDFAGVPWETIIKVFRKRLGATSFPRLEQYSEALISFLTDNALLFPAEAQAMAMRDLLTGCLVGVAEHARDRARTKGEKPEEALEAVCRLVAKNLAESPFLSGYDEADLATILDRHAESLASAWAPAFDKMELSPEVSAHVRNMAAQYLCRAHELGSPSGVVVAGFGEEDIFPAVTSVQLVYVSENRPRYGNASVNRIAFDQTALVAPFAQIDLIALFMEGVDPAYRAFMQTAVRALLLEKYPQLISDSLAGVPGIDPADLKEKLMEVGVGVMESFSAGAGAFIRDRFSRPVTRAVSVLPKEDLASLAESLVNLTSLRKRVTLDPETVGGPVDVVVISKGDGLVWMKRKHYFRSDLNPHFFTNYFREVKND